MNKKKVSFNWVDWLLVAAITGLSVQLSVMLLGPAWEAWKNRPRPGMQVPQQYLVEQGSGESAVRIPINYLLYLAARLHESEEVAVGCIPTWGWGWRE